MVTERKKFNLFLDLDQTLIYSIPTEDFNFTKDSDRLMKFSYYNMEDMYLVVQRPYLQEFLDFVFANFNVSIWTAATKDYATSIIEKVILVPEKPERKLEFVFFSYHCDISDKISRHSKFLKILKDNFHLLQFSTDNTVIVDDLNEVQKSQPSNCIVAPEFIFTNGNPEKDDFLQRLTGILREKMGNAGNIQNLVDTVNKQTR